MKTLFLLAVMIGANCFATTVTSAGTENTSSAPSLTQALERIHLQARRDRLVAGGALIGLGVASAAGAALVSGSEGVSATPLWLLGGFLPSTGALVLLLPDHRETLSEEFLAKHAKGGSMNDAERIRGETLLAGFAAESRHRRLMSAGALGVGGLTIGALGLHYQASGSSGDSTIGMPLLVVGAAYIGIGISQWLGRSVAEEVLEQYRQGQKVGAKNQGWEWNPVLSPLVSSRGGTGATLGLSIHF